MTLSCSFAWAQSAARGSISGTVTDPHGKVIPRSKVTIRSNDFSTTRRLESADNGTFSTVFLPAGVYTVEVESPGFKPKKLPRVSVNVGSEVRLTIPLQVAGASEQVKVTATGPTAEGNTLPPAINKQDPEVSNFLAGLTVTYLPNRDRDFTEFGQLAAASVLVNGGLSIAGQRPTAVKFAVDGFDFVDPLHGGERGGNDSALFFPQTAVREFQIVQSGAGAETGNTNAGFVNVVTKAGSNKFHGEGFYIGRPSALSSRDTFDHSLDNLQNEFGGSFGGPIRKDRIFYYLGAEQDFLHIPYWTQFQPQAPGVAVPQSLRNREHQVVGHSNPTAIFGRTEVILNSQNTLNLEFDYNRIHATDLTFGSTRTDASESNSNSLVGHSLWGRGNLTTLLSPTMVNQFVAQWASDLRDVRSNVISPEIVINGFGRLGGNSLSPQTYKSERRELGDDLAINHGNVLIQLGALFAFNPVREEHEANLNGRFDFDSLADYVANLPRRYQQTFLVGDSKFDDSVRELGFYIIGKFPVTKALTLSGGLRWQGQWNPQPVNPNPVIPLTTHISNDLNQWQPRLGLAWNPASKTVVRLSSGLYAAATPATIFQRVITDNGLNNVVADSYFDPQILPLVSIPGLIAQPLAAPPAGLTTPAAAVFGISPDFRNPRSSQASANVEQQFSKMLSVSAGFLRNSTWDLQRRLDVNLNRPSSSVGGLPIFPGMRSDPSIGRLLENQSSAHSSYNALLLTANLQLPHRSQLVANYTLSSANDDDSNTGPFAREAALDPFNLALERGYSSLDIRHNFNLSGVINLPLGFKCNPVFVARSGAPYTPVIGFDLQNDANDFNERALLGGTVAKRNSLRQPAFYNLDIRFVKDFTLPGEGHHLDLFLDVFNVTGAGNRNFGPDAINLYGTSSTPIFSAGQALYAPDTNHFGSTRQVQFTARIVAF